MVELLPCPVPWCKGGLSPRVVGIGPYYVICQTCGCCGLERSNRPDAVTAWNTRYTKQPDEAAVECVARALAVDMDDDPDRYWTDYVSGARAALAALQADTPDKEMGDG